LSHPSTSANHTLNLTPRQESKKRLIIGVFLFINIKNFLTKSLIYEKQVTAHTHINFSSPTRRVPQNRHRKAFHH
jgi:hypothetical protein